MRGVLCIYNIEVDLFRRKGMDTKSEEWMDGRIDMVHSLSTTLLVLIMISIIVQGEVKSFPGTELNLSINIFDDSKCDICINCRR